MEQDNKLPKDFFKQFTSKEDFCVILVVNDLLLFLFFCGLLWPARFPFLYAESEAKRLTFLV